MLCLAVLASQDEMSLGVYDWMIELPSHEAGGPFDMTIKSEKTGEMATLTGILYGEVWINTGQSNIEFCLKDAKGGIDEIKNARFPEIRYYTVPNHPMVDDDLESFEEKTSWDSVDASCLFSGDISAIGYYYSVMLYQELGVPIGMIDCYKGGTSISCWMERSTLETMPEGRVYLDEYDAIIADQTDEEYQQIIDAFNKKNEEHDRIVAELLERKPDATKAEIFDAAGPYSWPPPLGRTSEFRPCGLVESMLKRVAPYTVKGAVFYQGEEDALRNLKMSSSGENTFYRNLLVRFIQELRRFFLDEDLPFIDIQLCQFIDYGAEDLRDWAYLREAQDYAINYSGLKNTYLVPLIDLGEYDNVHPLDKKTPGERVGQMILGIYGVQELPKYPDCNRIIEVKDYDGKITERLELRIANAEDGLEIRDNELLDLRREQDDPDYNGAYGFEILVRDERTGDEIWVTPPLVTFGDNLITIKSDQEILGVSYGFFNYGKVNLYNSKGLPLKQFRVCYNPKETIESKGGNRV